MKHYHFHLPNSFEDTQKTNTRTVWQTVGQWPLGRQCDSLELNWTFLDDSIVFIHTACIRIIIIISSIRDICCFRFCQCVNRHHSAKREKKTFTEEDRGRRSKGRHGERFMQKRLNMSVTTSQSNMPPFHISNYYHHTNILDKECAKW